MTTAHDQYVLEERKWLDDNRAAYADAITNLGNPQYVIGLLRGVESKMANALSYNPKDDQSHVAVFILGELQAKMNNLLTDLDFVEEYEGRRKDYIESIEENKDAEPDDESHSG